MIRRTLLIAEPDALQRQLIDLILAVDAFDLTLVESGEAALAHLREHTPDALLVATDLPDVDGFTLCQKAKSVGRLAHVKVVLVADAPGPGGLDEKVRSRARSAGADLLLQRPLGDKNLRERIQRLLAADTVDDGMAPPAVFGTGILEPGESEFGVRNPNSVLGGGPAASELGALRAEVARLRGEIETLKVRLTKYKQRATDLQDQLDGIRKKPRGFFGRRT